MSPLAIVLTVTTVPLALGFVLGYACRAYLSLSRKRSGFQN